MDIKKLFVPQELIEEGIIPDLFQGKKPACKRVKVSLNGVTNILEAVTSKAKCREFTEGEQAVVNILKSTISEIKEVTNSENISYDIKRKIFRTENGIFPFYLSGRFVFTDIFAMEVMALFASERIARPRLRYLGLILFAQKMNLYFDLEDWDHKPLLEKIESRKQSLAVKFPYHEYCLGVRTYKSFNNKMRTMSKLGNKLYYEVDCGFTLLPALTIGKKLANGMIINISENIYDPSSSLRLKISDLYKFGNVPEEFDIMLELPLEPKVWSNREEYISSLLEMYPRLSLCYNTGKAYSLNIDPMADLCLLPIDRIKAIHLYNVVNIARYSSIKYSEVEDGIIPIQILINVADWATKHSIPQFIIL